MKKVLIWLLVLTLFGVLISCEDNNESVPEEIKDTPVTVTIIPGYDDNKYVAFRLAMSEYESVVYDLKYTAVKADEGFKTGETTEEKEFKIEVDEEGAELTLSLGYWNITLKVYDMEGNVVGNATLDKVLITKEGQEEKAVVDFSEEITKKYFYTSFEDAVNAANATGEENSILLLQNVEVDKTLDIEYGLALGLNGHTIKATDRVFNVKRGLLVITNGTIDCTIATTVDDYSGKSVIKITSTLPKESGTTVGSGDSPSEEDGDTTGGDDTDINYFSDEYCFAFMNNSNASVYIDETATIYGRNCYGITAFGEDDATASIQVLGTIITANPCISGQGNTKYKTNLFMEVGLNAVLTSDTTPLVEAKAKTIDPVAIYQPNNGFLRVDGGTITSVDGSAVEIRAGKANILGGKFISKAEYKAESNSSGPTVKGAALAVSQHSTEGAKNIEVRIWSGIFDSAKGKQLVIVNKDGADNSATLKVIKYGQFSKIESAQNPTTETIDGYEYNVYKAADKDKAST